MSASNYGPDIMEWQLGRGRSSVEAAAASPGSSRKGKRATAGSSSDVKPARQPQRGLGVAQLEKIRMQSEMAEYFHHPPPGQPPALLPSSSIHGAASGNPNLDQDGVLLSSPPSSSSYHGNISVSSSHYPIHPNLYMMANHGGRGDMRYAGSQSAATPIVRSSPNYHGAFYGAAQYHSHSSNGDITLPLFEPADDFICFRGQHDLNQSVPVDSSSGSMNSSDDPHDVDLELKL